MCQRNQQLGYNCYQLITLTFLLAYKAPALYYGCELGATEAGGRGRGRVHCVRRPPPLVDLLKPNVSATEIIITASTAAGGENSYLVVHECFWRILWFGSHQEKVSASSFAFWDSTKHMLLISYVFSLYNLFKINKELKVSTLTKEQTFWCLAAERRPQVFQQNTET